tara:strand:- start:3197 stop:3928 length:732 start_codon:yes stop_codon:yes gene_type:complete
MPKNTKKRLALALVSKGVARTIPYAGQLLLAKDLYDLAKAAKILVWGAGRADNPDRKGYDKLYGKDVVQGDPYHDHPDTLDTILPTLGKKDKDLVISNFVLNTLKDRERDEALQQIASSVSDDGFAEIRVRGTDVTRNAIKSNWPNISPSESDNIPVYLTGRNTVQVGYTPQTIMNEVGKYFDNVELSKDSTGSRITVLASSPKIGKMEFKREEFTGESGSAKTAIKRPATSSWLQPSTRLNR